MKHGNYLNILGSNKIDNNEGQIADSHFVGALDTTAAADFWERAELVDHVDYSLHHPLCSNRAILGDMIADS